MSNYPAPCWFGKLPSTGDFLQRRFPDVLQSAGLDWLPRRGYRYRLWRQHPDSHQIQVLASSEHEATPLAEPVPYIINMANGKGAAQVRKDMGVGEGDEVTVFSAEPGNDLETMARVLDTIPYEIMTSVSSRVKRIYLKE